MRAADCRVGEAVGIMDCSYLGREINDLYLQTIAECGNSSRKNFRSPDPKHGGERVCVGVSHCPPVFDFLPIEGRARSTNETINMLLPFDRGEEGGGSAKRRHLETALVHV